MNEVLKKKSPAKSINWSDVLRSVMVLAVLALGAIIPQLAHYAEELIGGSDAANTVWGYALLALVDLARRWHKDNTKD